MSDTRDTNPVTTVGNHHPPTPTHTITATCHPCGTKRQQDAVWDKPRSFAVYPYPKAMLYRCATCTTETERNYANPEIINNTIG